MNTYFYDGPVYVFDKLIVSRWTGKTIAESPQKAKSNLMYQFKRAYGYSLYTKITLPNDMIKNEKEYA